MSMPQVCVCVCVFVYIYIYICVCVCVFQVLSICFMGRGHVGYEVPTELFAPFVAPLGNSERGTSG